MSAARAASIRVSDFSCPTGALGISPLAWEDACVVMRNEDAAIVIAAMLQRSEMIVSAGGYLRNLTERA
jgi:replication initiation protein RepC